MEHCLKKISAFWAYNPIKPFFSADAFTEYLPLCQFNLLDTKDLTIETPLCYLMREFFGQKPFGFLA